MSSLVKYILWAAVMVFSCSLTVDAQIAIVINDSNEVSDLSLKELERIYLGKITAFSSGVEVELMEYRPLLVDFYSNVLNMSVRSVRKYWMKKVFSGDNAIPPTEYTYMDDIQSKLSKSKGAICFVKWSEVKDGMKVLSIEGILPDDAEYPLKETDSESENKKGSQ